MAASLAGGGYGGGAGAFAGIPVDHAAPVGPAGKTACFLAGCLFLMRADYGRRFAGASRRYGSGGADEPLFVSVRFFSPGPAGDQIYAGGIFYHSGSGLDQILGIGRLCSLFDGVANGMGEFV